MCRPFPRPGGCQLQRRQASPSRPRQILKGGSCAAFPKAIGWTKYVTVDMIIPHHERAFLDAFNIYPNKDIDSFYARCIEDYDLVYDWNHNPLYGDDEEEQ